MIGQDTFPSELKYCKDLVHSLKNRQSVDSSRAVLYIDTRGGVSPVMIPISFAANESKLVSVTYDHPEALTPYTQLQFTFRDFSNPIGRVNYVIYRDTVTLSDEYTTTWLIQLRNIDATPLTMNLELGVKSSAPGTLSGFVL